MNFDTCKTTRRFLAGAVAALLCAVTACGGGGGGGAATAGPGSEGGPAAATPPTISTPPQALTAEAGAEGVLRVVAAGAGPLAYQWLRNGAPVAGATAAEYRTRFFNADNGAAYAVVVTGAGGSMKSAEAVVRVTSPVLPSPVVAVESATRRATVRAADGLLQRVAGSDSRFQVLSGAWPVGTVFLHGQTPYKVSGISAAPLGAVAQGPVLQTEPADAEDVFTDLKFKVTMNPVAYDAANKPLSSAQLVQADRRRALGLGQGGKQGLPGLIACLTPKGEIKNASADGRPTEFGYEWEIDCSIEKLLGKDDSTSGLRFGGSITQSGTIEYVFDQADKTQYQEKHITSTKNVKVLVAAVITPAVAQRLSGYCNQFKALDAAQNYCEVKTDDGKTTIELARTFFDPIVVRPVIGGVVVPMYLAVGLTFKVEVSATGEVVLSYTTKKTLRTGHIRGEKVNDNPPVERTGFDLKAQLQGEVDMFLGIFVAAGVGESGLFSVVQTQVDLGGYAAGAVELIPPCARLDKGAQVGLKVTVGRSRWWNGWDPIDTNWKESAGEVTKPDNCTPVSGKVHLSYVVSGKSLYSYDPDASTGAMDVYNAQYALVQRVDPLVPKTLRIDLAGSRAPAGKTIVFDATLLDDSKQSFVNLFPSASAGPGDGAHLVVNPGSNSYGDTLKLKISAYVPGNRAATEVSRVVALKFEPRLEAAPYYRNVVSTDGSEYVSTEFVYRGETASRVKGGYVLYDDGHKDPLEQQDGQWQTQATRMQNYCAWYRHDCTDTPTRPVQLVLYSVASKDGVGQVLPISYSQVTAIERLDLSPASVGLFDILTLKASGRGMKQVVNVQVPNCRNIQEKRSDGNVRMDNWATDYREFSCETTAAGTDLVASVEEFPAVFNITSKDCDLGSALWRGDCTVIGKLMRDPTPVTVGQEVQLWLAQTWTRVASVIFSFVVDGVQQVAAVANQVSDAVSHVYRQTGTFILRVVLRDEAGNALASPAEFWVDVGAAPVQVSPLTALVGQQQRFVVTGAGLPARISFNLPGCQDIAEDIAAATASSRSFVCTFAADTAAGAVEGTVATSSSPFGAPPLRNFTVMVSRSRVDAVQPASTTRTVATSFEFTGQDLPTSGLTVVPVGDSRSTCQVPNNLRVTGFGVACELFKVGPQVLEVRRGAAVLGSVTVNVASNVTGVTWASPSTSNSGTVLFGETVTYKVAGTNLLADQVMGFAVERCGVSNTEVGVGSNAERTFSCLFNNDAGAVAGQMPGVVKDAPGGQVLFDGWKVPVETAPALLEAASKVPHTGIGAGHCYQAGSHVLVDCASAEALALSGAGKQDGMYADRNRLGYAQVSRATGGLYAKTDCVRDNNTGLVWEGKEATGARAGPNRYTNYGDGRSGDASSYLSLVQNQQLCARGDWRMPTATELFSLIDLGKSTAGGYYNSDFLPNAWQGYWALPLQEQPGFPAMVDTFNVAVTLNPASNVIAVRLVSGPQITGLQAAGGEVLDRATGLVWKRCVEGMDWNGSTCTGVAATYTHEQAFARARNQGAWRLPNLKELQSLQEPALRTPTAFAAAFPAQPPFTYGWVSTPTVGPGFEGYGYMVGLQAWQSQTQSRSSRLTVRLVRDRPTTAQASAFEDGFSGTVLDPARWSVSKASSSGNAATLTMSGGFLNVSVSGGSCGSCGVTDGSVLAPRVPSLAGDFEVLLSGEELLRTSRDGTTAWNTLQLVLKTSGSEQVGIYIGGDVRGNTGLPGHQIYMYSVAAGVSDVFSTTALQTGQYYAFEFRVRRSQGQIYLGHRIAPQAAWTEVPVRQALVPALAFDPMIVFGSGDGGGTRVNSSFSARLDAFSIR